MEKQKIREPKPNPFDLVKDGKIVKPPKMKRKNPRIQTFNHQPSKTQKGFEKQTVLKNIVQNAGLVQQRSAPPIYGDMTEFPNLSAAITMAEKANQAFMALPAATRAKFNNSPKTMSEFVLKPENREEAVALGIIKSKEQPLQNRMLKRIAKSLEKKDTSNSDAKK